MRLTETTPATELSVALAQLRLHLRLPEGFGADTAEDTLLSQYIAAATQRVERLTGLALVSRPFRYNVERYDACEGIVLPIGPVETIDAFGLHGASGVLLIMDGADLSLSQGETGQRVTLAGGRALPTIPEGAFARVAFTAGFGTAADVPADLVQAVLLLAAAFYEGRAPADETALPAEVAGLLASRRPARLTVGA
ncbi:MAG: hypothetical protein AAGI34_08980 [Pseudomonadota bacterium]